MLETILKIKKKKKTDRSNPRTNGKSKAIQRKSHTGTYTYTITKKEKGEKYIYCCSQSPPPQFGMIRCVFMYSTDAGYIKLIVELYSAASGAAGRDFPFSSLFSQLPGAQLWIWPRLCM